MGGRKAAGCKFDLELVRTNAGMGLPVREAEEHRLGVSRVVAENERRTGKRGPDFAELGCACVVEFFVRSGG